MGLNGTDLSGRTYWGGIERVQLVWRCNAMDGQDIPQAGTPAAGTPAAGVPQVDAPADGHSGGQDDPLLTVGAAVRRLREQRGWSLSRLAVSAHLSKQHLWDIEHGAARPHELAIKYLARALGARVSDLMGETSPEEYVRPIAPSLREFARRRGLDAAQVEALAGLNYRGRAPESAAEWELIWRLLGAVLDDAGQAHEHVRERDGPESDN